MFNIFKQTKVAPRVVAGDEVAELTFFNNTLLLQTFVLHSICSAPEEQHNFVRPPQTTCAARHCLQRRAPTAPSPSKLDDYLYEDRSVVGLHVVSFHDATVLTLNWIHAAFDATAKKSILDAWNLVMLGREDQIPTPVSYRDDALKVIGKNPLSPHTLADRKTSTLGMIRWALSSVTDLFFRSQETRIIRVPAGFVEDLHAVAMRSWFLLRPDLCRIYLNIQTEQSDMRPFLSSIDGSNSPFKTPFPPEKCCNGIFPLTNRYIANCGFFFNVLLPIKDVLGRPLSYTTWQIRRAIKQQTTAEKTEAYCALLLHMLSFSNWTKIDFFGLDFSAAALKGAGPVRPKYIQNVQTPYKFTEMFPIIGKDGQGNYWLSGTRTTQNWDIIEQALREESPMTGST
ncbi:hypothetical protein Aspvir_006014 [Aspergillus viridinutans]|uniref:Uncharacterized protein n=1 Tax=Aspergillus viridinutans TaxID=75553 RepID=A0A9P3BYK5_ASPVI|nr:uncharacterized protein Aspvir_006014 [Aspergillus viridinutans]GIK01971.1 hypothetical protein Aspvir_006014 [Aspergillus viridinutans]